MLFVATLGVVAHAVARGWWGAAGWTLLFDVLLNGYPVMLQRYNRALLGKALQPLVDRWPSAPTARRKRRRTIQLTIEAVGPSTIEGSRTSTAHV